MLAGLIKNACLSAMGNSLDLIRLTDIGDRQLIQIERKIKDGTHEILIAALAELEKAGIIEKCNCLVELLKAKEEEPSVVEKRDLYEQRRNCTKCGGSGYLDRFKVAKER